VMGILQGTGGQQAQRQDDVREDAQSFFHLAVPLSAFAARPSAASARRRLGGVRGGLVPLKLNASRNQELSPPIKRPRPPRMEPSSRPLPPALGAAAMI